MNAAEYAVMIETGRAPCGCRVEFNSGPGDPEGHTCFHDENCALRRVVAEPEAAPRRRKE